MIYIYIYIYIYIIIIVIYIFFSEHIIPPVTIVTDLKTQFFTHLKKNTKYKTDYFKGLLVTRNLEGNNLGLNRENRDILISFISLTLYCSI